MMNASDVKAQGAHANLVRARRVFGIASVIVGAAYAGILCQPAGGVIRFLDNVHWTVAYVAGATLAWMGVGAAEKEDRVARRWFAAGLSAYSVGQVLWDVQVAVGWNPFPGPSDLFFLALGPACAKGLWITLRMKIDAMRARTAMLDIAMLSTGALMLTLALYLPLRGDMGVPSLVVLIAYPLGLLTAVSIAVVLALTLRLGSDRRWLFFFTALVITAACWMKWNALTLQNKLQDGSAFNLSFSVAALAMGWGALRWQARTVVKPSWDRFCEGALRLLPLALVVSAAISVVLAFTLLGTTKPIRASVAFGAVLVASLATARQSLLLSERDRLLEAEQKARESEDQFKALFDHSPDAIFIIADDVIADCNGSALRLFGSGKSQLIRQPVAMLFGDGEGGQARAGEDFSVHMSEALAGRPQSCEWKARRPDGGVFDAEASITRIVLGERIFLQLWVRDITERKQAALATARLADIVESSDDAIIGKNLDSIITSWNRGAEEIFGYTADEMIGRSITLLIPPDRREEEEASIMRRIRSGASVRHFETVRLRKDGTHIDVSVTISAIRDHAGRVIGASKVVRDITERAKAERALLSERNFSAAVIDSLPGILYLYDEDGKFLRWNKNFERVSGYTGAEISAMHPMDFFAGEDKELITTRIAEVFANGQSDAEADFVSKDGSRTPYYFTGRKITLFGKVCLVGVGIDVTARRESESEVRLLAERLTYATDAARIGVWDWNIGTQTWYVTPMYFTMLGLDPAKGFNPQETWLDRLHPEDRPMVEGKLNSVLSGLTTAYSYQARMALADGSYNWFHVIGRILAVDDAGRPSRLIGVRIDISESKRREAEIRELNAGLERRVAERTEQLQAANKELEAFSYSVSHDLRAPLRTVDGYSQAVLEDFGESLPEEGRRYLSTIRKGAQQMGELIDDLLKFARLSRATMEMQSVDMNRLVKAALSDLHISQSDPRVELRLGNLPTCMGDPALLRQVWVNLLSNAFKYSGRRAKAVIEVGVREEDGQAVYFVRDNGAGFDMRYADKLFGVFQRLHRAEDYEGTGVGLAIGQRVVHRHGGHIWAEAKEDQGATFYFTIGERIPS